MAIDGILYFARSTRVTPVLRYTGMGGKQFAEKPCSTQKAADRYPKRGCREKNSGREGSRNFGCEGEEEEGGGML